MDRLRGLDVGAFLIGLIIVGVGTYYLLQNMFGFTLPELDWETVWPLAVIAVGIGIVWRAWSRARRGPEGRQGN
jgi:hypothetical protein